MTIIQNACNECEKPVCKNKCDTKTIIVGSTKVHYVYLLILISTRDDLRVGLACVGEEPFGYRCYPHCYYHRWMPPSFVHYLSYLLYFISPLLILFTLFYFFYLFHFHILTPTGVNLLAAHGDHHVCGGHPITF